MKMLLVGGTFDEYGGKHSKIIEEMGSQLECLTINGGYLEHLNKLNFKEWDILIWMPNISNDAEKILPTTKHPLTGNYKLLLVSSKNARDRDYQYSDFIGRMLKTKSNLGIYIEEFKGHMGSKLQFSLFDPLGNRYAKTFDIAELCHYLKHRIKLLRSLTRIGSECIAEGEGIEIEKGFIEVIRNSSEQFSKFVNANNPNRLLGNASTRCASGFPAIRKDNKIFVTRRNVDKVTLSSDDFVEVKLIDNKVKYYGSQKPSVDTAIQIKLFDYYPNINYMIHGHVYIKDAFKTRSKIPCGYIEEFNEITDLFPDKNTKELFVNLKGHGCLIASDTIEKLKQAIFIGRDFPET